MRYFSRDFTCFFRSLALLGLMIAPLMLGCAAAAQAKTYVETARAMLKNLPGDAQIRVDLEAELVAQANAYRATQGVGALAASPVMREAARAQAADMMLNNFVGHRSTSGYEFDSRARYFLGNPAQMPQMAENAARDTQKGEADRAKAQRLFQQWVHSPPHRKSLINSGYRFVSTGVIQRGSKIYAIQIFFSALPDGVEPAGSGTLY